MKGLGTIFRRELAAYFATPVAYVFIVIFLVLTGVAEVLTDRAILQQIWDANPLLRQYLGTIENPALIVYRVKPVRVRYMKEWALEYHEVAVD